MLLVGFSLRVIKIAEKTTVGATLCGRPLWKTLLVCKSIEHEVRRKT